MSARRRRACQTKLERFFWGVFFWGYLSGRKNVQFLNDQKHLSAQWQIRMQDDIVSEGRRREGESWCRSGRREKRRRRGKVRSAVRDAGMEMLRRSSVFAAEVFDRSPTDKELVSQAKALCRDYIHSRLNRAGIGWSKPDHGRAAPGGALAEVSPVLLWLGEFLNGLLHPKDVLI
ncbi:Bcl-2-related ovarian killer A [Liparis tanakae]|uniref:Bcl-2-related ovarian killer A n=1 Tax=Liparis tanakae TaxID=230148 RepID=A0A4Z2EIS4_9TELE|nr:Bcl-2-related ovarian killer A [Liparis tanakae]